MSVQSSSSSSFHDDYSTPKILTWAGGLETFERMDFVYRLIHSLFPTELRYIHGIIDGLLKRDEALCSASVQQANDYVRLSSFYEAHVPHHVLSDDGRGIIGAAQIQTVKGENDVVRMRSDDDDKKKGPQQTESAVAAYRFVKHSHDIYYLAQVLQKDAGAGMLSVTFSNFEDEVRIKEARLEEHRLKVGKIVFLRETKRDDVEVLFEEAVIKHLVREEGFTIRYGVRLTSEGPEGKATREVALEEIWIQPKNLHLHQDKKEEAAKEVREQVARITGRWPTSRVEENGGVAIASQPAAAPASKPSPLSPTTTPEKVVPKTKAKPAPVTPFDYTSDEEIPITKLTLRKKPAPAPLTLQRQTRNSRAPRDSSPEIPLIKSSGVSRPRLKSPISSSSSSEDEADDTGEPTYAVRNVLDMQGIAPDRQFLIQWEGYDSEDDTWEPEEGVSHLLIVKKYIADRRASDRRYDFRGVSWKSEIEQVFEIPSRKYCSEQYLCK